MTKPTQDANPKVLVACKRGSDRVTEGQSCDSKTAYRLTQSGSHAPRFKCVKCGYEWIVPVGGQFNYP